MKFATIVAAASFALLATAHPVHNEKRDDTTYGNTSPVKVDTTVSEFCKNSGLPPTNGQQLRGGSCSSTIMGSIPAAERMVATTITYPEYGQEIKAGEPFEVRLVLKDLQAGAFSDPTTEYYVLPQNLNAQGQIIGHQHVVIQAMGDRKSTLDPLIFAFFKGINEAANERGELTALVDKGLPTAGWHRICTLSGSESHQPIISPIAQRGPQDDCIRVKVV